MLATAGSESGISEKGGSDMKLIRCLAREESGIQHAEEALLLAVIAVALVGEAGALK